MAMSHVELYELLKPTVGERAAELIAQVIPPADDLARKGDIAEVKIEIADFKVEMAEFRGEMREALARLHAEIKEESTRTTRWMLTFFIPLWIGTWGTVLAVLLKH